jgi:hypothetical protein
VCTCIFSIHFKEVKILLFSHCRMEIRPNNIWHMLSVLHALNSLKVKIVKRRYMLIYIFLMQFYIYLIIYLKIIRTFTYFWMEWVFLWLSKNPVIEFMSIRVLELSRCSDVCVRKLIDREHAHTHFILACLCAFIKGGKNMYFLLTLKVNQGWWWWSAGWYEPGTGR